MRSGPASVSARAVPARVGVLVADVVLHHDQVGGAGLRSGQEQAAEEIRPGRQRQEQRHQRDGRTAQQREEEQHHDHRTEPRQERFQQAAQPPTALGTTPWSVSRAAVSTAAPASTRPRAQTDPVRASVQFDHRSRPLVLARQDAAPGRSGSGAGARERSRPAKGTGKLQK